MTRDLFCRANVGRHTVARLKETVLHVYRNQLDLPDMKAEDNFFDAGDDSLLASQIMLKLRQNLGDRGHSLRLSCIFDYPSVREMSDWLERQGR